LVGFGWLVGGFGEFSGIIFANTFFCPILSPVICESV
jgi:hypothetical protein